MSEEFKKLSGEILGAFEEYKKTNDERIAKVEKGQAISEVEEKLAKIDGELNKLEDVKTRVESLEVKAEREGDAPGSVNDLVEEHKAAFSEYIVKGNESALKAFQEKAVNITTAADGEYLLPEVFEAGLMATMLDASPMRRICDVKRTSSNDYKINFSLRGATSGWVDEDDARPETNSPTVAQIAPNMGEIYAAPQATQTALDDLAVNGGVERWLAEEVGAEINYRENLAFVAGTGVKQPKGFTAYTTATTADSARAFGTLQHIASGVSAGIAADNIYDVIGELKSGLRQGATFVAARRTITAIRKLKDGQNQYLWQPGLAAGQPQTLAGYAVAETEDMPAIGANALAIAFGNFKRGYVIVDRIGIRMLRDPYTNKPKVIFYTTKRVGGAVRDSEAIKFIKCDA